MSMGMSMRSSRSPVSINLKLILLLFLLLSFLLLLLIRSDFQSPPQNNSPQTEHHHDHDHDHVSNLTDEEEGFRCSKSTPASLANALIHYATTNITPQQSLKEISVSARILQAISPCNFLVFGLGHDSLMWAALNHGGRTVFLEEDSAWIHQIQERMMSTSSLDLEAYHVHYHTKVHQAEELMKVGMEEEDCKGGVGDPRLSKCPLALKAFPAEIYEMEWDLIMVDAPTGYFDEAPGRMSAIYTAGLMARNREEGETHVLVHDVDRVVEDNFSFAFLCQGYLRQQEGRIRHFTIPTHRTRRPTPFCPPPLQH